MYLRLAVCNAPKTMSNRKMCSWTWWMHNLAIMSNYQCNKFWHPTWNIYVSDIPQWELKSLNQQWSRGTGRESCETSWELLNHQELNSHRVGSRQPCNPIWNVLLTTFCLIQQYGMIIVRWVSSSKTRPRLRLVIHLRSINIAYIIYTAHPLYNMMHMTWHFVYCVLYIRQIQSNGWGGSPTTRRC